MHRAIPVSSKLLSDRWHQIEKERLDKNIKDVKSRLDN
jgi:hypothetical protein